MEKGIPCKWKSKESWSSNTHIRQKRLQNKDCCKRQRRTLHNDQGINPRGKIYGNICICITDLLFYKAETNTPL